MRRHRRYRSRRTQHHRGRARRSLDFRHHCRLVEQTAGEGLHVAVAVAATSQIVDQQKMLRTHLLLVYWHWATYFALGDAGGRHRCTNDQLDVTRS